jgi:hypothetical protein
VFLTFYSVLNKKEANLHGLFMAVADIDAYVESRGRMWSCGWNILNASSIL